MPKQMVQKKTDRNWTFFHQNITQILSVCYNRLKQKCFSLKLQSVILCVRLSDFNKLLRWK